jgi:hypothetical protein
LTNKPNKPPTQEDYLTREEFRTRFDAEKLNVQRHYCTLFAFWRSCRFKACRRQRGCRGDQHECLKLSVGRVPRPEQYEARQKLLQATPGNLPAPEFTARQLMPNSFDDSWDAFRPRDIPRGWTRSGVRQRRKRRQAAEFASRRSKKAGDRRHHAFEQKWMTGANRDTTSRER